MRVSKEVLRRLEWSEVRSSLAEHVRTPMGRARAEDLLPRDGFDEILREQDRLDELRRAREEHGRLPLTEVFDPKAVFTSLTVRGHSLSGRDVFETVRLLVVAREVADALRALDPDEFPTLGSEWARFPDLGGVIGAIHGNVAASGELEDHASPELARIRREIRQLSERLESVLGDILRKEAGGPVLRDGYFTVRNERYVVPVRTDTPRAFPGIVHGTSSTERTLFVEPMQTVEINNRLVELRDEERREIDRILARYTAILADRLDDLETTARVLADVDLLEASASWAELVGAVRPRLVEGGGLRLRAARHPGLESTLRRSSPPRRLVPLEVDMPRELHALVISGPNAGGKTVALKTIGLLTLIAHAGLPVPAEEAQIPLFAELFADIGDEQSIGSSLSTFASHVRNLATMVRDASAPALCLTDEIGTGTDPAEGAALGTAVLDRLLERGVHVVATTHHAAVKAWAYRSKGTLNAACEFDESTMRPTYRLVPGVAGSSIGLTMAEQMGLDREVVEAAKARLDPSGVEAAKALDSVRALASDLEHQRAALADERRTLRETLEARERELDQIEARRKAEWERQVEALVASFREDATQAIRKIEDRKRRQALDLERSRREKELRMRYSEQARAAARIEPPPAEWTPSEGAAVLVASLGKGGTVKTIRGKKADVLLGRSVFTVPLDDLRPPAAHDPKGSDADDASPRARRPALPGGVSAELDDRTVPLELELLGMRADEAIARLDKYLDDACLAGLQEVRIVHGYGTGRLKKAVREHLSAHPNVASFADAGPEEGAGGATIARLG